MATTLLTAEPYPVSRQTVESSGTSSPPKQLLIIAPNILLSHLPAWLRFKQFLLHTQLIKQVASHGYIVAAPQLYSLLPHSLPCNAYDETNYTADVTNWQLKGLQSVMPENVKPDLDKLALAGHSRGGKIALSLALDPSDIAGGLKFLALVGVDPVVGFARGWQIKPDILTNKPCSLDFGCPAMIIGTGLGGSCAPEGVNHDNLYYESKPPCYHFVAADYGHMDMLDDKLNFVGKIASCVCKKGAGTKEALRRCVGGLVVAFLEKCFVGESENIFHDHSTAPVTLFPVERKP